MRNSLEHLIGGLADETVSDIEDRRIEIFESEKQKINKKWRKVYRHREPWDTIKHTNIDIMRIPKRDEKEKMSGKYIRRSNMMKNTNL